MKLGRLAAQFDPAVPKLGDVLKAPAPLPPTELRYRNIQYSRMLLNDQLGDCTVAGIGDIWEYWKNITGVHPVMTDNEAEVHYSAITGYVPGKSATDTGAVELDVLKYFSNIKMISSSPAQLTKFIAVSSMSIEDIKYSVHALGNCYIGVNLPDSAMTFNTWDVVPRGKDRRWSLR